MAEQFNKIVKDIFLTFKALPSGLRSKLHIDELQHKIMNGIRTEPMYAITVIGPLVWRAREEIKARDAQFFLQRRYEIDLQKLCKEHDVNYENAINTVFFMKDAYRNAPAATQTAILDSVQSLLATYSTWTIEQKMALTR